MEIKIDVSDEQFKSVLEQSLSGLPEEKIQEVVFNGLKEYLTKTDVLENLCFTQDGYYSSKKPSVFLNQLLQNASHSDVIQDMQDEMLQILKNNYNKILTDALSTCIINSLVCSNSFVDAARMVVHQTLDQMKDN